MLVSVAPEMIAGPQMTCPAAQPNYCVHPTYPSRNALVAMVESNSYNQANLLAMTLPMERAFLNARLAGDARPIRRLANGP